MNERILIIDDEEHIRRMMRITLEAAGYEVGEAGDGCEGIRVYNFDSHWNAVVLDQRMPGIDGLETLRRIKEFDADARIIMATAYASIELAVEAMKLGATDFVRKPITPETLRNSVRAALARRPTDVITQRAADHPVRASVIETLTMNGFTILDHENEAGDPADERRFAVIDPDGSQLEVTVQIDKEVIGYVARLTRRRLPSENSFWTSQARRLLSSYLWTNGEAPLSKKLILHEISRDELPIAEKWEQD